MIVSARDQTPSGNDCGPRLIDAARALSHTPGQPTPPPPPTASLKTYVAALRCAQTNDCGLFDENGSVISEVQANRSEVSFQLTGLKAGTYVTAG